MASTLPLGEKARADARGRSNSWSTWQSGMETALTLQVQRNRNLDRVTKEGNFIEKYPDKSVYSPYYTYLKKKKHNISK